eukprot:TRINITY_DN7778_c0_g1_i1.p1 TRINITY_DN7778_c0_g1~~TRINITY_DN7778_c0_g1_i1.p1  ORF type:complete len:128 (-),score=18.04 TRINITY_DN7778_c0_g1_i1:128-511(-)
MTTLFDYEGQELKTISTNNDSVINFPPLPSFLNEEVIIDAEKGHPAGPKQGILLTVPRRSFKSVNWSDFMGFELASVHKFEKSAPPSPVIYKRSFYRKIAAVALLMLTVLLLYVFYRFTFAIESLPL